MSNPRWVMAHGKRILVETLDDPPGTSRRLARRVKKRKPFEIEWVKLPDYWIQQLKLARYLATYTLALHVLRENFKQQYAGGDIVLSTALTGLPRTTRWLATKEMVELGLIQIQQDGRQAVRIVEVFDRKPRRRASKDPS
jgi:hypothetical protein